MLEVCPPIFERGLSGVVESRKAHEAKHVDRRSDRYLREQETDIHAQIRIKEQARTASVGWLATLSRWDLYATLTYDPTRSGYEAGGAHPDRKPPTAQTCERHFAAYIDALSEGVGRLVSATGALESTKAGWPHFHALLSMEGCNVDEFKLASRLWFDAHGFCLLTRVAKQDPTPIAAYLAKYFTKSHASVSLLGPLGNVTRVKQLRLLL